MTRGLLLLMIFAVVGCSIRDRTERRWAGPLTAAHNGTACPQTHGTLVLRADRVVFTPDDGIWILTGEAHGDALAAQRSNAAPNHQVFQTALAARWTEAAVTGTYTTPVCTYAVNLVR